MFCCSFHHQRRIKFKWYNSSRYDAELVFTKININCYIDMKETTRKIKIAQLC